MTKSHQMIEKLILCLTNIKYRNIICYPCQRMMMVAFQKEQNVSEWIQIIYDYDYDYDKIMILIIRLYYDYDYKIMIMIRLLFRFMIMIMIRL